MTIEILSPFFPLCKRRQRRNQNVPIKVLPGNAAPFYCFAQKAHSQSERQSLLNPEYPEPSAEAKGRGSPPGNTNYRRMLVGNYIVFYKINDAEKQIDIYRILRASWDLPKYL
jgi:mRNA-degrading endonuclease RelE of RelBE toxin-antitoxin system